jgi:hypothetical protein
MSILLDEHRKVNSNGPGNNPDEPDEKAKCGCSDWKAAGALHSFLGIIRKNGRESFVTN